MTETSKSGTAGWVKIALGLSVAVNLFFIGLTGGALFDRKPEHRDDVPNSFMQTLSAERATEVKAFFQSLREDRKASRQGMRQAWAQVREAMIADPYDRDALEAAMQQVMDARNDRSEARYAKMVDFVSGMDRDERVAFSDAMRERWKRRRERRGERDAN